MDDERWQTIIDRQEATIKTVDALGKGITSSFDPPNIDTEEENKIKKGDKEWNL